MGVFMCLYARAISVLCCFFTCSSDFFYFCPLFTLSFFLRSFAKPNSSVIQTLQIKVVLQTTFAVFLLPLFISFFFINVWAVVNLLIIFVFSSCSTRYYFPFYHRPFLLLFCVTSAIPWSPSSFPSASIFTKFVVTTPSRPGLLLFSSLPTLRFSSLCFVFCFLLPTPFSGCEEIVQWNTSAHTSGFVPLFFPFPSLSKRDEFALILFASFCCADRQRASHCLQFASC